MKKEEMIKILREVGREIFKSEEFNDEIKKEATKYIYYATVELDKENMKKK